MRTGMIAAVVGGLVASATAAELDADGVPEVADGFEANIMAREPAVFHVSALAFGRHGRLFAGGGPQYRDPSPETPGDKIWVLLDKDRDGTAEEVKTFAKGFNSIQGLAWHEGDLWVANPPDVTVVRDKDGDLTADEYVKVFTNLGHLRHGLHGFNWGPDGRLYMSQGNSKVQKGAPRAFRKLHGVETDQPVDQPVNKVYAPESYKPDYIGKWPSKEGGFLRCRDMGRDLEIYARGNRNPWDWAFDGGFNWLAVDQDPGDLGDRVLTVFEGAHFGFGHPRGFSWTGEKNPYTVPPSYHFTRYKKNSLVGMVYYTHEHFPKAYRNVFFINDWANNNIYTFRPKWDGALMKDAGGMEKNFADGGKNQGGELTYTPKKGKPLFRPTDLAVGPSGALFVGGWGKHYGSKEAPYIGGDAEAEKQWGRVFRIRHERPLRPREKWHPPKREKPYDAWSAEALIEDLDAQLPVWRTNAQEELVRRGEAVRTALLDAIRSGDLSKMAETYAVWALGRMGPTPERFARWARGRDAGLNRRIQAIRIVAEKELDAAVSAVADQTTDAEARVRFAAAQALRQLGASDHLGALLEAAAEEEGRLCYYAQWRAMQTLASTERLVELVTDADAAGVKRAAALALLEHGEVGRERVQQWAEKGPEAVRGLASAWLDNG